MKRILDRTFKYVPSAETDIRKTFARIRREQQKNKEEATAKVTVIKPNIKAKP
jgi:hypothetical protein